ncbi:uncharacterized protein LOC131630227 [Vicia villosa]|uniref:uncharacterized protein LOC131630227 n=1 Tax=Vicia villosa TaxID=3911 RepID=UPI00273AEA33|nr:uncharacterized protein LOC131630227 [Vicia villosa]
MYKLDSTNYINKVINLALGRSSVILAEFWGVYEGLTLTLALGIRKVEVNIDLKEVVLALEEGRTIILECVAILRRIKNLMDLHEIVVISHAYRSTNMCADVLAKRSYIDKTFTVNKEPPEFLWPLMAADSLGISSLFLDSV